MRGFVLCDIILEMADIFFIFGAKYLYIAIAVIAFIYFSTETWARKKQIAILGAIALPSIYIVAKIIGLFYYSTLPFVEGDVTSLIPHEADNGFPSDHTLLGAAISSVMYFFSKKISAVLWALTLVVGASRMYVGVHHPIDVAGSIIIAIAVTVSIYGLILAWRKGMLRKNKGV